MFNLLKSKIQSGAEARTIKSIIGVLKVPVIGTMLSLVIGMMILCLASVTHAQVLYGSLTGTITDQSDSGIAGAKVEITGLGTGIVRTLTTDERGVFRA